jgi:hypothetical protein
MPSTVPTDAPETHIIATFKPLTLLNTAFIGNTEKKDSSAFR